MNDDYVFELDYTLKKLSAKNITPIPKKYLIKLLPEHVSFGNRYVAIMSPLDCTITDPQATLTNQAQNAASPYKGETYDATKAGGNTGISVRYFKYGTVADVDVNPKDGFVDGTSIAWTDTLTTPVCPVGFPYQSKHTKHMNVGAVKDSARYCFKTAAEAVNLTTAVDTQCATWCCLDTTCTKPASCAVQKCPTVPTRANAKDGIQQCTTFPNECNKGTLVDYDKGWTCRDHVATAAGKVETTTKAWTLP